MTIIKNNAGLYIEVVTSLNYTLDAQLCYQLDKWQDTISWKPNSTRDDV